MHHWEDAGRMVGILVGVLVGILLGGWWIERRPGRARLVFLCAGHRKIAAARYRIGSGLMGT